MGVKKAMGLVGFYLFADMIKNRFVAGDTLNDAVLQAKILKERKEKAVINILGEHARDHQEVMKFRDEILRLIKTLAQEGLTDVNIAVKPSQLGLDISELLYTRNYINILETALIYLPHALVEIDAEDHFYRERVLRIVFQHNDFLNQRIACQINRSETREELPQIIDAGISIRLCKGNAYPGDITYEKSLRTIFFEMIPRLIGRANYPAFATHDLFLLDFIAKAYHDKGYKFELELLMGIEKNLSQKPEFRNFTIRRYVPYGPNWRHYAKRRAELIADIWWRNFLYRRRKNE